MDKNKKDLLRQGFIFFVLSTLTIGTQFLFYLIGSPQIELMDTMGMVYYIAASYSHAAIFASIPFLLLFLPVALTGFEKTANTLHVAATIALNVLFCTNAYIFSIYKFHINGMVLSMYLGEGGSDIISFDTAVYVKAALVIVLIIVGNLALRRFATFLAKPLSHIYTPSILTLVGLLVFSNLFHAYAAVAQKQSVMRSARHLPYYFPLSANKLMVKMGVISADDLMKANFDEHPQGLAYPLKPLVCDTVAQKKNIVIIAIDSWNYRAFNNEVMPRTTAFAEKEASAFTNHLSSSNGTRGSIFGMFYGASSYYWGDFDVSGVCPVMVNELLDKGYDIRTFASATLQNPNFAKLMFYKVKDLKANTEGADAYARDLQLTKDFTNYLDARGESQQPFFSFLFYDLAHSGNYPKDKPKKFTPSWDFPDYMQLNNDMDPTLFWNLYLNCMSTIDSLVGVATDKLAEKNLLDNTIVIITGDHGQEFNENHKNYWGHGSNYTYPQIHIPFIYHQPGMEKRTFNHRTTHYDVSPTLLHEAIGVRNEPSDYGMGRYLTDTTFRNWHVVGDNLNFAFIVEDNVIIEKKPSGSLEICDGQLNPLDNYKLKSKELQEAIANLNKFYSK